MASIIDYIKWRGDLTFNQVAAGEVDGLVFSAFSYIQLPEIVSEDFTGTITIKEIAEFFAALPDKVKIEKVRKEDDIRLLDLMGKSKRYEDIEVQAYQTIQDTELETQFAAYTLRLNTGLHAVVYRGTDTSLIGWKEDLNLSFLDDMPGQVAAKKYLEYVAKNTMGNLILCGHSKGGNLAVYAASSVSGLVQKRIKQVYNYDGPGFMRKFLEKTGYINMIPKIHTLVPQSSVVGMLLEHEEPYQVVKSTNVGLTQHEPHSWLVLGPDFEKDAGVDNGSKWMDASLHTWLAGLTREEREEFVTAIHKICMESKPEKLKDLVKPQNMFTIFKAFNQADPKTKEMITKTVGALAKAMTESMTETVTENVALSEKS